MHLNILSPEQIELLPLIRRFRRSYYLVAGTAIALHVGHRRSFDFDLFTPAKLSKSRIRGVLRDWPHPGRLLQEDIDQLHVMVNHVKVTFLKMWTIRKAWIIWWRPCRMSAYASNSPIWLRGYGDASRITRIQFLPPIHVGCGAKV